MRVFFKASTRAVFFFVQQSWSCTLRPLAHIIEEGTLFCDHNNVHFTDRCDSFETGVMKATCALLEEVIITSITWF